MAYKFRMPTVVGETTPAGGHCFVVTSDERLTPAQLIGLKIAAEFRKWRAGGDNVHSVHLLLGSTAAGNTPYHEQETLKEVQQRFLRGEVEVFVNGLPLKGYDYSVRTEAVKDVVFKLKG